jgi:hypothetical protein
VSVGLGNPDARDSTHRFGADLELSRRSSLGGLAAPWPHLGGCADLAIMAGSGAPCPERKLKSAPACLLRRFPTPGCRSDTGDGCRKPNLKSPSKMKTETSSAVRVDSAPAHSALGVSRRSLVMNSAISAASLASATTLAAPAIAAVAPPAAQGSSFPPGLVARLLELRDRHRALTERDRAQSSEIFKAFTAETGITREEWHAIANNDPRYASGVDVICKVSAEIDTEPKDADGCSIAWSKLADEIDPVAEAVLARTPRSLADLRWQAEAMMLYDATLASEEDGEPLESMTKRLIKNILSLAGEEMPAEVVAIGGADPIFAAIEAHRSAVEAYVQAVAAHNELEESLPQERRRSVINAHERKIVETDDPRWIEAELQIDRLGDAMEEAAITILESEPATPQAAAAVLRYMVDHIDRHYGLSMGWPDGLIWDGVDPEASSYSDHRSSEYFLMRAVANGLERLTPRAAVA